MTSKEAEQLHGGDKVMVPVREYMGDASDFVHLRDRRMGSVMRRATVAHREGGKVLDRLGSFWAIVSDPDLRDGIEPVRVLVHYSEATLI